MFSDIDKIFPLDVREHETEIELTPHPYFIIHLWFPQTLKITSCFKIRLKEETNELMRILMINISHA